jgi:hypothetical protein
MIRPLIASLALGISLLMPMDAHGLAKPAAAPPGLAAVRTQVPPSESQPAVSQPRQGSGLPQQAPTPRTMREFWPVFVLLSLGWIGIVGYLLRCGAVFGRIAEGVRHLDSDQRAA